MPAAARHTVGPAGWIGLALGPVAWALTQQLSYSLASFGCNFGRPDLILIINGVGAALALVGAGLSWRGWRRAPAPQSGRAEHHFVAGLGMLLGLLFAFAMLGQGAAGFFFTGCER